MIWHIHDSLSFSAWELPFWTEIGINAEQSRRRKQNTISTGNGIHSFYCRKRKHLQWQCWKKKVNRFASSHIFVLSVLCSATFIPFQNDEFPLHFHPKSRTLNITYVLCAARISKATGCIIHVHGTMFIAKKSFFCYSISLTTNQHGPTHMSHKQWIIFSMLFLCSFKQASYFRFCFEYNS